MASEASWQTSSAGKGSDAFSIDQPMDQRTVESLLRRLVERVEDSERRYGEALDELHARLDRLSETTEAARDTGAPEDADTFDRLHAQVSNLACRLEGESAAPLDDFERLGKALAGGLHHDSHDSEESSAEPFEPSPFARAAMSANTPADYTPASGFPDFSYAAPEPGYSDLSRGSEMSGAHDPDLDKRLVEMAERLEQSIGAAMPTSAIEALNMRLDEIGSQLSQTLEKAPSREALEHVERQISDMSQQLGRAEEQLGKVGGVEAHLLKLIERLDEKAATPPPAQMDTAQREEIASKAAAEAARLVAGDTKQSTERLDAMQRDITAMSDKSAKSGDRLVSTLEAVHESLKQLVQQVEWSGPAFAAKPRAPFTDRARQTEAKPAAPFAQTPAPQTPTPQTQAPQAPAAPRPPEMRPETDAPATADAAADGPAKDQSLRDRLGAAIPDFKETETPPPFGRAKRSSPDEEAVDLDAASPPQRSRAGMRLEGEAAKASGAPQARARVPESQGQDFGAPDDLVAAARRAAQAAAARAEERGGRRPKGQLPGSDPSDQPRRRKRSLLIISAAALLVLSALLLYGRLGSKPEPTDVAPAATEEMSPAPSDPTEGAVPQETAPADTTESMPLPETFETAPALAPDQSGSWLPLPEDGTIDPMDGAVGQVTTGFTEVAKSSRVPAMPASELTPEPQLASLKPIDQSAMGQAALPPGVIFSIEDPAAATRETASLPLPPAALGPLPMRQAAAQGDAAAQYAIAIRYADGNSPQHDLKAAAEWLERAARSGLAPAQYRLAAMYERGLGLPKDIDQARIWYTAAAEKGNIKAMHNLAVSISGRDGGTPDYALAAKWYGEAAAYGLADSQFNLGILAEHGLGMTKNLTEAYKWFALSAASGDAEGAKRREVIRVQLAPETLAEAEATVKAWTAKEALAEANEVAEQAAWVANAPATKAESPQDTSLVARTQALLNKLGYDVGPPDGIAGERTRSAIKQFETRNGLQATGEVSIPLVTKLERLAS